MLASGDKEDRNTLKALRWSALECGMDDLDRMMGFLEYAKGEFEIELIYWEEEKMEGSSLQLHYRDWYQGWSITESDFSIDIFKERNRMPDIFTFDDAERSFERLPEIEKETLRAWEEEDRQKDAAEAELKRWIKQTDSQNTYMLSYEQKEISESELVCGRWVGGIKTLGLKKQSNLREELDELRFEFYRNELDTIISYFKYVKEGYSAHCLRSETQNIKKDFIPLSYGGWKPNWSADEESDFTIMLH